jgi:ATP-binding protein involved in chromosome partitioning
MITQEVVQQALAPLIAAYKAEVSTILVKDGVISFAVFNNIGQQQAEQFKQEAEGILKNSFIESRILIVITNKAQRQKIAGVTKIILVCSGKGGVGKSTISCYLAKYLAEQNKIVGLLDSDIYGPSIPTITGLQGQIAEVIDGKIAPIVACQVKVSSIAFLSRDAGAFAWRGPMIGKATNQLFTNTAWGQLDYLIVDTPPGTGDVHLTILGSYHIDGVIIVTSPAQVSGQDTSRTIDLCQKFAQPIYGIIENMSYYENGNQQVALFGTGAGLLLSKEHNVPLLDSVKMVPGLAERPFAELTKYMQINFNQLGF